MDWSELTKFITRVRRVRTIWLILSKHISSIMSLKQTLHKNTLLTYHLTNILIPDSAASPNSLLASKLPLPYTPSQPGKDLPGDLRQRVQEGGREHFWGTDGAYSALIVECDEIC